MISSSGFANRCVLQQCDVGPVLFGDNAVADIEGEAKLKHVPHVIRHVPLGSRYISLTPAEMYCNQEPRVFVHADLMGYADNHGNLSHRDLERGRQYICWAGTRGRA